MRRVSLFAVLLAACTSSSAQKPECSADSDCAGPGPTCLAGRCFQIVTDCGSCPDGSCTERCLTGVPGPKGDRGDPGPQGVPGPKGDQGVAGPQGAQGPKGDQGVQGVAGPKGDTGAQGAIGAQGPQGVAGAKGDTGATGPAGPQGNPGPQGAAGQQGPAGTIYGEEAAVFAGFTSATYTAARGSREAMHAACDQQFAGSHLCHYAEFQLTNSATPVPASGAWIDRSGWSGSTDWHLTDTVATTAMGRYVVWDEGANCHNWSALTYKDYSGTSYDTNGTIITPTDRTTAPCKQALPLACCRTPYKEKFRGFTTTINGAQGGRALMHYACATQFPGSHMCHYAEYQRATSTVTPPAAGAWIDRSGWAGATDWHLTDTVESKEMGRYVVWDDGANCHNWSALTYKDYTGNSYDTNGTVITPVDRTTKPCKELHSVACCQ